MGDERPLEEQWEERALAWAAAARAPGEGRDRRFWEVALPALVELLPPPGRFAVDVGCGEGRLTRELTRLGYPMAGFDASPTLVGLAREADPWGLYEVSSAYALDVAAGNADLVVASMVYHDLDDLGRALREAHRVLARGGQLLFSILHPALSGTFRESYYDRGPISVPSRRNPALTMPGIHRTVGDYLDALEQADFALERLSEPETPEDLRADPKLPLFLIFRARKR